MTVHLNRFIDRVRAQESRAGKDFVMSMTEARDLHADITKLLLELNRLREAAAAGTEKQVIEVKMHGGTF